MHECFEFVAGARGYEFDGAANGVAPIERALRAAQHLDPINVEKFKESRLGARYKYIVHIDADARISEGKRVVLTDAANIDDRVGSVALIDIDVRRGVLQPGNIVCLQFGDAVSAEGGHGDRHVL